MHLVRAGARQQRGALSDWPTACGEPAITASIRSA
jgi:hypothetical protein